MRRADRLFQIVQLLRSGRLVTARQLAEKLEVSERTIYRDIADLQGSGVPVEGEAGIGYLMRDGYDLPPIMFTRAEMEALIVGARLVSAWGGARMALGAEMALSKIENVLPEEMRGQSRRTPVFALDFRMGDTERRRLDEANDAIAGRHVMAMEYEAEDGVRSSRRIEPLGLYFWGRTWTLVAWCRLRGDFRVFRVDRIQEFVPSGEQFRPSEQRSLRTYLARIARDTGRSDGFPGAS